MAEGARRLERVLEPFPFVSDDGRRLTFYARDEREAEKHAKAWAKARSLKLARAA